MVAPRQLRGVPVKATLTAAACLLAAAASAEHPGRTLESRRSSAPVVYLATVETIEDIGPGEMPGPPIHMMQASLKVDRVLRSDAPTPVPSSATYPPATATVRYRKMVGGEETLPATLFYKLAAGDRVVVFAPSWEPSFPVEMIPGPAKAVTTQVTALRDYLATMDEMAAQLHGVTPAIRTRQTALYDRILAELRSPPLR